MFFLITIGSALFVVFGCLLWWELRLTEREKICKEKEDKILQFRNVDEVLDRDLKVITNFWRNLEDSYEQHCVLLEEELYS